MSAEIETYSCLKKTLDMCPVFQRKVLKAMLSVPRGTTITYKEIAQKIGRPGAARAVGNALANNPFPIIIPCHRAIRSDGTLGGYQGGTKMKRALLKAEGARVCT
ncbi:MAG: MGMT family protein [Candidatus Omnitrophica bacterium]|nr:MGMT family protein [Candidatus Omnitrophota bacterium]